LWYYSPPDLEIAEVELISHEVSFKIVPPTEEDAKVANLVRGEIPWYRDPTTCQRILTTKSRRFGSNAAFCCGLRSFPLAGRYATAEFWQTYSTVQYLGAQSLTLAGSPVNTLTQHLATVRAVESDMFYPEGLKKAQPYFTLCSKSEGSSPYLKGLATYYLLRCKQEEMSPKARSEQKELAKTLLAHHPETFMAQEAAQILESLKMRKKE
jgi:hypothetical protein